MATTHDRREAWDRLVLLLAARPRDGWEEIFEEITHREVERLAPHHRQMESPTADPEQVGQEDGTKDKEHSAYGCIIPD